MNYLSTLLSVVLLLAVLVGGCKKEKRCGLDCENGGACENGVCDCPLDYSGTTCETAFSSTYGGEYTSDNFSCGGAPYVVTLGVTVDPANPRKLAIDEMFVEMTDATHFKITEQKSGYPISGTGTIDGKTMTIKLSAQYPTTSESCTGSFKKK